MKFAHIENKALQDLLEYGWNGDEDDICQALTYSADAVAEDAANQLLDTRVVDARADALADAEEAWNDSRGGAAVEALRRLWLV